MIEMLEAIRLLEALSALRSEILRLREQMEIPGITSEDRIGLVLEIEGVGKKIIEAVMGHRM